eukprot:TRINITY_DN93769_c0_g1_i1.p1 TRINITY_DN93769_c0_g1~~TRINITY_DN93769_c0_g1_i1.p1  ORF type:complete len:100 (+),score=17.81 TRINITY_DN93769_c0_g1_i1:93-392(+)
MSRLGRKPSLLALAAAALLAIAVASVVLSFVGVPSEQTGLTALRQRESSVAMHFFGEATTTTPPPPEEAPVPYWLGPLLFGIFFPVFVIAGIWGNVNPQ